MDPAPTSLSPCNAPTDRLTARDSAPTTTDDGFLQFVNAQRKTEFSRSKDSTTFAAAAAAAE